MGSSYFFPKLYKEVDWKKPIVFLEQEFQEIIKTRYKGKQIVDKLAKLHLKNGKKSFVLLHAEPQSTWESDFPYRMLVYYLHIGLRYPKKDFEFTAIAIYTGLGTPKVNNIYKHSFHGTEIRYQFNTCVVEKLAETELKTSNSPIALALLAAKYEHQSRGDETEIKEKRFGFKKKLVTLLYKRNYSRTATRILLEFIKYVVTLPQKYDIPFIQFVKTKIEEKDMARNVSMEEKKWLDDLYFGAYGETPDDRIAKAIETEKTKSQKALEDERQKAKQDKLTIALTLIKEKVFSKEQIATITKLPLSEIERLISKKDK